LHVGAVVTVSDGTPALGDEVGIVIVGPGVRKAGELPLGCATGVLAQAVTRNPNVATAAPRSAIMPL
jgi:hypothetical protein